MTTVPAVEIGMHANQPLDHAYKDKAEEVNLFPSSPSRLWLAAYFSVLAALVIGKIREDGLVGCLVFPIRVCVCVRARSDFLPFVFLNFFLPRSANLLVERAIFLVLTLGQ